MLGEKNRKMYYKKNEFKKYVGNKKLNFFRVKYEGNDIKHKKISRTISLNMTKHAT